MISSIRKRAAPSLLVALAVGGLVAGCTAVSHTPAFSGSRASRPSPYHTVHLTSGSFSRPHRVIGIIQAKQEGYRWLHEKELVEGANPRSVLYFVAKSARDQGADGVQHLVFIDENPQSPGEKTAKQVHTALKILQAVAEERPPTALAEGTETSYRIQGELIEFTD